MSTVLALSPHLDDAAFSAGAVLAALAGTGHEVTLATAFTRSVPSPEGFALACQTDKGIGPEVDYLARRREEDRRAAGLLGLAQTVHLPFAEAPHRGYGSAPELFGAPRRDDDVVDALRPALEALGRHDLVLAPLGVGDHVDHRQLLQALAGVDLGPVARWHDVPYVLRLEHRPIAGTDVPVPGGALARKLDACATYTSQLVFQFGSETAMRRALGALPERFEGAAAALRGALHG